MSILVNKSIQSKSGEIAQKVIQMEHELLSRGIPEEEVHRSVIAYFSEPEPPNAMPWPGPITGLDLAGRVDPFIVPDTTGVPLTDFTGLPKNVEPYPTPNKPPYPMGGVNQYQSNPTPDPNSLGSLSNTYNVLNPPASQSANWTGLASDVNSEPSMHNEYGFNSFTTIPTFPDSYEALHSDSKIRSRVIEPSGAISEAKKPRLARYVYQGHDKDDICAEYDGRTFDLNSKDRPVPPSERSKFTTTHPNCNCYWNEQKDIGEIPDSLTRKEQSDIDDIKHHITKAAKDGSLHTVKPDGGLSQRTRKTNPMKESDCNHFTMPTPHVGLCRKGLQEAISNLRNEFAWLTDDYVDSARRLAEDAGGTLYLVRAAGETITNHTSEGEPYRRKLSADELNSMSRTAIGKSMDINHQPEFETDATVLDVEFDKRRKEMQMLIVERDPEINKAITNGQITAVSINGGMPRSESIEPCDHGCESNTCELCLVPKGVVLGELDNIAVTWVVTDKNGLYWNSHYIPSAEPGIKFTAIESL